MNAAPETHANAENQTPRLVFLVLSAFLLLLPYGLVLPGTPGGLKADEAAYYMMAMSLAFDGDAKLEAHDTDRLFDEFSGRRTRNLVVSSPDGWDTIYYGKPHLYSLLAAPFARVAGYRGILQFNMMLFLGLIWMLARSLRYTESSGKALLFASSFFLLSTTWNYAFWIQPEILSMFGVGGALFFGLKHPSESGGRLTNLAMAAASGGLLAIAVYNKPYIAPLGLVFLFGALHHGRTQQRRAALRWFAAWSAGAAFALIVSAASAWMLTGNPSTYLGVARDSATICEPGVMPLIPELEAAKAQLQQEQLVLASTVDSEPLGVAAGNQPVPSTEAPIATTSSAGAVATAAIADAADAAAVAEAAAEAATAKGNDKSWAWIFRIPPVTFKENVENILYFFVGRHTGLFLYFPFAAAAIACFLLAAWRNRRNGTNSQLEVERWTLLASSLGIGLLLLVFISWNWQGGGGFVGNRYFVVVVPAFGYLVTRLRALPLITAALAAGLFLGPSLVSPLGLVSPEPTLQAHTRSDPLSFFPLELTLKNLPGYYTERLGGMRLVARKDRWLRRGESFWVQGRSSTDITALADGPLGATAFLVTGITAEPATIDLDFAGALASVTVSAKESKMVTLTPQRHRKRHNPDHQQWNVYPLSVTSDQGSVMSWQRGMPRNPCPPFARNDVYEESFFAGAQVSILGPQERLEQDIYSIRWDAVTAPTEVTPEQPFLASVRATNTSSFAWPAANGAAAVKFSYHWLDATGTRVVDFNGVRSHLETDVSAGETVDLDMSVTAPKEPGDYLLEIDPLLEHVAWFKDREADAYRIAITVSPAMSPAP